MTDASAFGPDGESLFDISDECCDHMTMAMEQPRDEICRTARELICRMAGGDPRQPRYINSSRLIVGKSG